MKIINILIFFMPLYIYAQTITIAVDAVDGSKKATEEWTPTIDFLNKKLPQYNFKLYPFIFTEFTLMQKKIEKGDIDFIISTPGKYINLEVNQGVSKILTLGDKNGVARFGAVIFTHKDSVIKKISYINHKTKIVAIPPAKFGGWMVAFDELITKGIDIDEENVKYVDNQEDVIQKVKNHKFDIGIIRTGVFEKLQKENPLILKDILIINRQKYKLFPYIVSTQLYPAWALAKTKSLSDKISREVAHELLMHSLISNDDNKNYQGIHSYWTTPYSYQSIRELMERLEKGPYENQSFNIIKKLAKRHHESFYLIAIVFILIFIFLIYAKFTTIKLKKKDKENKLLLKKIKNIAYNDVLTNIPNRLSIMEEFNKMLTIAQRNHLRLGVMFFDLDGFKTINDILGHKTGDRVLQDVASILKSLLRKDDLYGRLGGDEFVIVTLGMKNKESLEKICTKLLDKIDSIFLPSKIKENFGVSIGVISIVPNKDTLIEPLLHDADEIMYEVKQEGKNGFIIKYI